MPDEVCYSVVRVQKQHSSLVVVIPKLVRDAMKLKVGDYVVYSNDYMRDKIHFSKFVAKGAKDDRSNADLNRDDQDGGA